MARSSLGFSYVSWVDISDFSAIILDVVLHELNIKFHQTYNP